MRGEKIKLSDSNAKWGFVRGLARGFVPGDEP